MFPFEQYFGHVDFSQFGITLPPSSRENYKHYCPKKFVYYKMVRPEKVNPRLVVKQNYSWFRDGKAIHRVFEVYHDDVKPSDFGDMFERVKENRVGIIKTIVFKCMSTIPQRYKDFAFDNYIHHFKNFAMFEYDRMCRIDGTYDLKDTKVFERYYKPLFSEHEQNELARQHGISYRADIGFILPPGYVDNTTDVICIGDFKTGYGYYSTLKDVPSLTQKIKEQLVFPVPWMMMAKEFGGFEVTHCLGLYTDRENAFAYETMTREDFLTLYNDLMEIEAALKKNNFPRIYKFCGTCEYKHVCVRDEGLMNRIHYKLGIKKYVDVPSMQKESESVDK